MRTFTLIGPKNSKTIEIEDDEIIEIMVVKVTNPKITESKVL